MCERVFMQRVCYVYDVYTYFVCLCRYLNAVMDVNVVLDDDNVIVALVVAIEFPMNENVVAL